MEVAITEGTVFVRDSKKRDLVLTLPSAEWRIFLTSLTMIHPT